MPIAKKDLRDGLVLVAAKGTYVSNDIVDRQGWGEHVEPGADPVLGEPEETTRVNPTVPVPGGTVEAPRHRRPAEQPPQ